MSIKVSLEAKIPTDVHDRVQQFLEANPAWHYDDFLTVALSALLIQLGDSSNRDTRLHLDRMFYRLQWGKEV